MKFFDPAFTLLARDVRLDKFKTRNGTIEVLQIKFKSPKEDRVGREMIVDVYATNKRWLERSPPISQNKPAFRQPDGTPLTGRRLNQILKALLSPHVDYTKWGVSTHSFRGGMATLLGQLGVSDEKIQAMGRWRSRSFEAYLKMTRTKRA